MTYTLLYPVHPGAIIKSQLEDKFSCSIKRASEVLGVNRSNFNNVLNGHAVLTPTLALKVEAAFGIPARVLLQMQTKYSLWEAEQTRASIVSGVAAQQPVAEYA